MACETTPFRAQQLSKPHFSETFALSGLAGVLALILSWPAFKYFFFAEAFWQLRIYNLHGRHLLEAAFSRIDGMFFRPGLFLSSIWWDFVLPPNALVYHVRNFAFCVVNLLLFHRVLLRFVASRSARIVALGMLAASKIYLTIVGYINLYESSILLMTVLLSVLLWFRYIEGRRILDYLGVLLVCTFSVYSKDNGVLVIGILGAMTLALGVKGGDLLGQARYWIVRFAPFVIISASYLILRYVLTGPINPDNPVYSPRLSFYVTLRQSVAFFATVGNFSLTSPGAMGAKGLSGVLAGDSQIVELGLCAAFWVLVLATVWRARSSWRLLIVPLALIGLYLFPIFLIRNHQVYYYQESLAGLALLIGICLDQAKRPLLMTWFVVVAVIAMNGFISNQRSYYHWQLTANRAEIVKPIVESEKDDPPAHIVFVSSPAVRDFWIFAIGGPLVPQLLGSPDTRVDVVDANSSISPGANVYYLPPP